MKYGHGAINEIKLNAQLNESIQDKGPIRNYQNTMFHNYD